MSATSLVTGGGGFLGRYIVEKLVNRGDDVISLARGDYPELEKLGVRQVRASVIDRDDVLAATRGVDTVFHTAARVGIWGDPEEFYSVNVTGTRNVLAACLENGVSRLVYTSSPSVVFDGRPHEGIDESLPYPDKYMAEYPRTKAIAERDVLQSNCDRLLTCSIRPHLIWGPRDTNLVPRLVKRAQSGRLAMVGDGRNLVDTVYVDNAADAHLLAEQSLEHGSAGAGSAGAGSAYFISQGEPVNLWGWIGDILDRLHLPPVTKKVSASTAYRVGAALELGYKVAGARSEPPMTRFLARQLSVSHWFNIDKARRELGYHPAVGMDEGMDRLVRSLG